jgi:Pretoxin HINT domain
MFLSLATSLALSFVPTDTPQSPDASRKAYDQVRAAAGRDPDAQVSLALWCEAHGLQAERLRHLSIAVLTDPSHATARGLLGLVEYRGKWAKPDAVAEKLKADETLSRALLEYNARRDKLRDRVKDHYDLAVWCEANGLKSEAAVHFMNVTRLDPSHEAAWKHLGCRKYNGAWMSEDQIASVKTESEAQKAADKHWLPLLERWKGWLGDKRHRSSAEEKLAEVTDPRALRSVWAVFGSDGPANQRVAATLLGQIDGAAASNHLAILAVKGVSSTVRQAASEILKRRDPREYVDTLINFIGKPLKYEVRQVDGPGSPGILFVEGERYNVRRIYNPTPGEAPPPMAVRRGIRVDTSLLDTIRNTQLAQQVLARDTAQLDAINEEIRQASESTLAILRDVTGQDLGADPKAWRTWWTDQKGYAFITPDTPADKPTFDQFVPLPSMPRPQHSCFAEGTPVRTISGLRPIETIKIGDQVLMQDTKTGALRFQPIVAVYHNPPNATLRIQFKGDSIVATGIHRFWKAGKGWVMARELKPGDEVRTLGGTTRVVSVSPDKVQRVYNLDVSGGSDFFVGREGTLVHDNSIVQPTPAPFDAVTQPTAVATASK